jgi:hypothetical protein
MKALVYQRESLGSTAHTPLPWRDERSEVAVG